MYSFILKFPRGQQGHVVDQSMCCMTAGPQSPCERTDLRMAIVADHLGLSWTGEGPFFRSLLHCHFVLYCHLVVAIFSSFNNRKNKIIFKS